MNLPIVGGCLAHRHGPPVVMVPICSPLTANIQFDSEACRRSVADKLLGRTKVSARTVADLLAARMECGHQDGYPVVSSGEPDKFTFK